MGAVAEPLSPEAIERAERAAAIREGLGYKREADQIRAQLDARGCVPEADRLYVLGRLGEKFPEQPVLLLTAIADCAVDAMDERRRARWAKS